MTRLNSRFAGRKFFAGKEWPGIMHYSRPGLLDVIALSRLGMPLSIYDRGFFK
ncbi:MAG: hypothetical protein GXY50_06985 [Syntrophomonadaceae bacterium]|nr:hypothetical protein [Syntrophomonadaceae bacterium]